MRPPKPLVLPWAAMAAKRSKKSKMILVRASESTLRGMKVANESRARLASVDRSHEQQIFPQLTFLPLILPTVLSYPKQLVRFPRHHAAGQSTPAPFEHAAESLDRRASDMSPL